MLVSHIWQVTRPKTYVAVTKYNRMVIKRKLRIASFVPAPRLVKHQDK